MDFGEYFLTNLKPFGISFGFKTANASAWRNALCRFMFLIYSPRSRRSWIFFHQFLARWKKQPLMVDVGNTDLTACISANSKSVRTTGGQRLMSFSLQTALMSSSTCLYTCLRFEGSKAWTNGTNFGVGPLPMEPWIVKTWRNPSGADENVPSSIITLDLLSRERFVTVEKIIIRPSSNSTFFRRNACPSKVRV